MSNAALFPLFLVLTGEVAAAAEPAAEPTVPVPSASAPADDQGRGATAWAAHYDAARSLMIAGRFDEAAARFTELSRSASNRIDRTLAFENAAICREWVERHLVLAPAGSSAALGRTAPQDRRTIDELAVLYTTAVFYGLGSGGVLAVFTEPSSGATGILPALALGGVSAGVVGLLDHNLELRYGVPQSIVSGMMIGLEEGLAWVLWNQARVAWYDEWSEKAVAGMIWATTTAGAIAGGVIGTVYGTTPGRASLMGSAALWSGLVVGMLAGASSSGDTQDDHALLGAALALNGGALVGGLLGARTSPSIARVRFVDLGGLAGGILFGGLCFAASDNGGSGEAFMAITALGIGVGLGTAWALTSDMEPDLGPARGQKSLVARLVPMLSPASRGAGMVAGVGATF